MLPAIFLFSLIFKITTSEYCVCVPFWKCDKEVSSSDEEEFSLLGYRKGCPGYFDECCKVKCGQRKRDNLPLADMTRNRILGQDNDAAFGEFPWMLGIIYGNTYRCGASLIHPKVALTAAHCVHASGVYKIRAGEWDWSSTKEPSKHQDRLARKIIIHPKYHPNSLANDVAIVILESSFRLSDNVGVACLPSRPLPLPLSECVVTGWGKNSFRSGREFEPVLKQASLPIVPNERCERALQDEQFGAGFRLHYSFICAGGGGWKDTCKGDGGSPLVCSNNRLDKYEQVGIVSWGLVCGKTDCPGVYVNVGLFVEWIDKEMIRHNFDPMIYKV